MPVSKTQTDRLGERLKGGSYTEDDLRLLEDHRRSFGEAYEAVVQKTRQRGESPTGRLAKSTLSIIEKLRRESIRLSQMQDVAGCRIVVADVPKQDRLVAALRTDFPGASVIDRRTKPNFGYRAVHIIAEVSGKPIEIQVRTALQHLWTDLSEKSSDVLDPKIKYGGGSDAAWQEFLAQVSQAVASGRIDTAIRIDPRGVARWWLPAGAPDSEEDNTDLRRAFDIAPEFAEHFVASLRSHLGDRAADPNVDNFIQAVVARADSTRTRQQEQARLRWWNEVSDLLTGAISWLDERRSKEQTA